MYFFLCLNLLFINIPISVGFAHSDHFFFLCCWETVYSISSPRAHSGMLVGHTDHILNIANKFAFLLYIRGPWSLLILLSFQIHSCGFVYHYLFPFTGM